MSKQPTVAITGANGFVGATLVNYFAGQGWQVVGLVRDPAKYTPTKNVRWAKYDLAKPLGRDLLKGVTYLVHTAYLKHDSQHTNAFEVNVKAAERLVKAAQANKLKKIVFMSSMSAHDQAISVYGKQKLAIEKLITNAGGVSLRAGLIIGNGGIVKQMSEFMKSKHMVPLVGGGTQPLQIISVHDLARVIEQALVRKVTGVFTVAHPTIYTYKTFYQNLAGHLQIKVVFVPVPFYLLLGMMRTIALLHLPLAVSEDSLWGLKALRSAETEADLAKLGVTLYDLPEALQKSA